MSSTPVTEYRFASPFLSEVEPEAEALNESEALSGYSFESPFLSSPNDPGGASAELDMLFELEAELYDAEFNEAVEQFAQEVTGVYHRQSELYGDSGEYEAEAFAATLASFEPSARLFEKGLDAIANEAGDLELSELTDQEIDRLFDTHEAPAGSFGDFEYYWENLKKKSRRATKAARKSKKKGKGRLILRKVLGLLKKVAGKILNAVIRKATESLPPALKDAANKVREKLFPGQASPGGAVETGSDAPAEDSGSTSEGEVSGLGTQVDQTLAAGLFEFDATGMELELGESSPVGADNFARFSQARSRFVRDLATVPAGEAPVGPVQEFIPGLMTVVKIAFKAGLRGPVEKALGNLLANLIKPIVGPDVAAQLGQAIASQGLKMLGLEAGSEHEAQAVIQRNLAAQTLEATMSNLAQSMNTLGLTGDDLSTPELMEALVVPAFEKAVASNFPNELVKHELRESLLSSGWYLVPSKNPKFKRGPSAPFKISAQSADSVVTFSGKTLGDFLFDEKGLPRGEVKGTLHAFEGIPGSTLSWMSLLSKDILGSASASAYSQIHPLTTEAAAALLGDPSVGRKFASKFLRDRNMCGIQYRYYYLEIENASTRPTPVAPSPMPPVANGADIPVRPSASSSVSSSLAKPLSVLIDCRKNEITLTLYISEGPAQRLAEALRTGKMVAYFKAIVGIANSIVNRPGTEEIVTVIKRTDQLGQLGQLAAAWFANQGGKWVRAVISKWLKREIGRLKDTIIRAVEDPADGMTVKLKVTNPPAMEAICSYFEGTTTSVPDLGTTEIPEIEASIRPGYKP